MCRVGCICTLSAGSLLFAAALLAQTPTFVRDDFASYAGARSLVSADFDRNGWPDIAQANTGRNTVTVSLNRGRDGLQRTFDIGVGAGPFALTTGDFNRDGIADLAVANADGGSISLLLGIGDGTFNRRPDIAATGQGPRGITTADMNADGKADVIYTGYTTGTVQVLLGNGAGDLAIGPAYRRDAIAPQGVVVADFNRDGRADLAVACESAAGLRILHGTSGTAFTVRSVGGPSPLNVVAAADLNLDGWTDIAAASTTDGRVLIYLGSATGFTLASTYTTGYPGGITVADVNGDGLPDVMTADRRTSTVTVLLGDRAHPGSFLAGGQTAAGQGARAVVSGDFDGDGRTDLATGNQEAPSVTVLSNATVYKRAGYSFGEKRLGSPLNQWGGSDDVWIADFNRDGKLDAAVVGDNQMHVAVLLTDGPAVTLPVPFTRFAVGDLNGDGNADVLGLVDVTRLLVYLGNGHGAFTTAPATTLPEPSLAMAVGDINLDGKLDVALFGGSRVGPVWIMRGNGDGTFVRIAHANVGGMGPDLTIGDINRDGNPDVAVLRWDGSVEVMWGDGSGQLPNGMVVPFFTGPVESIGNPARIQLSDMNRDGYLDIIASGPTGRIAETTRIAVALGGPLAPVVGAVLELTQVSWAFAIGDLNMDGRLDVVTGGGELFAGNGDGTFAAPERFGYFGTDVRVTDFTRDGLPDIVFAASRGAAGVLVNQRRAVNRPPIVVAGPDRTLAFAEQFEGGGAIVTATGSDPDMHALAFEWHDASGALLSTTATLDLPPQASGRYEYVVTARDFRGGVSSDAVIVTITPLKEIVLHVDSATTTGNWTFVDDPTAADGRRVYNRNLGAPKVQAPTAGPSDAVMVRFLADPTQTYKLWLRLKADSNSWMNDSVWIQLAGATDVAGNARYRPFTTSALAVSLEECSGCGVAGWGWEDDGWGALDRNGVLVRFAAAGEFYIVLQPREDGVSIDQIVLSSEKYLSTRPGRAKNDTTILPQTGQRR
jgi:hypothetical protein